MLHVLVCSYVCSSPSLGLCSPASLGSSPREGLLLTYCFLIFQEDKFNRISRSETEGLLLLFWITAAAAAAPSVSLFDTVC
jgi:hypothetical protein